MSETLSDRLDAVERALTDDETDLTDVRDRAALSAEVDRLDARLDELEAHVEELDAAVEAVRGYAGNVRAVNRDVERRASVALAKVEALETAIGDPEDGLGETDGSTDRTAEHTDADRNRRPDDTASRETRLRPPVGNDDDGEPDPETVPTGADRGQNPDRRAPTMPPEPTARTSADAAGDGDGEDEHSGTEQFIERVRDAL